MTGNKIPNLVLKRLLEPFLTIPPLKKILEFLEWQRTANFDCKKGNCKPETKPMIENLQHELNQLESKQGKGAKLDAKIR